MIKLSEDTIIGYLLSKGLVNKKSTILDSCYVESIGSRNNNFCVKVADKKFLIKQVRDFEIEKIDTIRREACIYYLANETHYFSMLGKSLPKFYDYNYEEHVLVIEFLDDYVSLHQEIYEKKELHKRHALSIGECIGAYYFNILPKIEDGSIENYFQEKSPWVFDFGQKDKKYYRLISNADHIFFDRVSNSKIHQKSAEKAKELWKKESLIHGDIKWINFLVKENSMKLIDWELADIGDIMWDLAGAVQSYLVYWINVRSKRTSLDIEKLDEELDINIASLLKGFSDVSKIKVEGDNLNKLIIFTAFRLVQTALEIAHHKKEFDGQLQNILSMSTRFLESPSEAKESFFSYGIK